MLKFFTAEHAPYGLPPGAKSVHTYAGMLDDWMGDTERVWFVHCYGTAILPMAAEAIALGGHVRIGLGDETFDAEKPTNAELVARVVEMAHSAGRKIATPGEAREIMGLEARV